MTSLEGLDQPEFEQLQRELLSHVRTQAGGENFTGDSAIDLVFEIQRAAQRMIEDERVTPTDLDDAKQATSALLDRMRVERIDLDLAEFHEVTVARAISFLCPGFWPFC